MIKWGRTTETTAAWRARVAAENNGATRQAREAFSLIVRRVEAADAGILPNTGRGGRDRFLASTRALAEHWKYWCRPACSWEPQSRLPEDQFRGLMLHLFTEFPVPRFFHSVFTESNQSAYQPWFIHVGAGRNIRTAPGMTAQLTSRMAHHMLEAPNSYSVLQALRLGQVLGLGGSASLARTVLQTQLASELHGASYEAFWLTVLQWLVNHPELPRGEIRSLVDYLGICRLRDPEFEMKGRSAAAVLRLAAAWHVDLKKLSGVAIRVLPASGVAPSQWETRDESGRRWTVSEISNSFDLYAEGTAMRHCAYGYLEMIRSGQCSIWSLKESANSEMTRAVTLEVRNRARKVTQARGKGNRAPHQDERRILLRWALEHGLTVSA